MRKNMIVLNLSEQIALDRASTLCIFGSYYIIFSESRKIFKFTSYLTEYKIVFITNFVPSKEEEGNSVIVLCGWRHEEAMFLRFLFSLYIKEYKYLNYVK